MSFKWSEISSLVFASLSLMFSAELASAQPRNCWIDGHGVRHCQVVRPPPPPNNLPPSHPNYPRPPGPNVHPARPVPPPRYYNFTIQNFYAEESNVLDWDHHYQTSPAGSWSEQNARVQRDASVHRALSILSAHKALEGISSSELETVAFDLDHKYQLARAGSAVESMYSSARPIVWDGFVIAVRFDAQYARDFRDVESEIIRFDRAYQIARAGSLAETAYKNARNDLIRTAVERFNNDSRFMGYNELYLIQDEYNRSYQLASAGSALEKYYLRIRDIARHALSYRP